MRIIGGDLKGRKLLFPKSRDIRPATDRLKETIFNVLGQRLDDWTVLDLFAGMGSLGMEALSRGAARAVFVDSSPEAVRYIRDNLERLGLTGRSEILCMSVDKALNLLIRQDKRFSCIFMDPPYNKGLIKNTLLQIERSDILCPQGWLVTEYIKHEELPPLSSMGIERTNQYGVTRLSFLIKLDGNHPKKHEDDSGISR